MIDESKMVQMKGLKVLDANNNVTFAIDADGNVTINVQQIAMNKKEAE